MSVMLYPCILCVALLMDLFVLCVVCFTKQFTICLSVVVILVVEYYGSVSVWVEVICWIDRVWSSKECACWACDLNVHLSIPSTDFVYVFVYRRLSPKLRI